MQESTGLNPFINPRLSTSREDNERGHDYKVCVCGQIQEGYGTIWRWSPQRLGSHDNGGTLPLCDSRLGSKSGTPAGMAELICCHIWLYR